MKVHLLDAQPEKCGAPLSWIAPWHTYGVMVFFAVLCIPNFLSASTKNESIKPTFQQALTGFDYVFPRDHGSHDNFLTEWWYFTGHLFTTDGRRYGYELTFFRRAIDDERAWTSQSRWAIRQLYFAHFALTDEKGERFRYAEKISRAGLGKAGADAGTLHTWIDRWSVEAATADHRQLQLNAATSDFSIHLILDTLKSPVIHGKQGISQKGAGLGEASHYYSLTRLKTTGSLQVNGEKMDVSGISWMDHEFGSADLSEGLVGWDWFSIQLESGYEIMAYWLRHEDGTFASVSSGTLVYPDGRSQHLSRDDLKLDILNHWQSEHSGARYPNQWILSIPSQEIQLTVIPRMTDQELHTTKSTQITYWEGAVDVSGRFGEKPITGMGYVELTGYAEPYR